LAAALAAQSVVFAFSCAAFAGDGPQPSGVRATPNAAVGDGHAPQLEPGPGLEPVRSNQTAGLEKAGASPVTPLERLAAVRSDDAVRTAQTVALFALISLAPIALLMVTAFVRIHIVLILLRQALGSPQIPGNQILTALALLLTTLVMRPQAEDVYHRAIQPYTAGKVSAAEAWEAGRQPIKTYMIDQIVRTKHLEYVEALYDYAVPSSPGRTAAAPARAEDFPFRVVAPAYLLSELTTALLMGFYIYLPFLVIDLVVSSVLAATGLFMLPPALVATPVKLIVFVLANGWLLIAEMLLSSFAVAPGAA
jgi:flagellar biosynthetic protein FliP